MRAIRIIRAASPMGADIMTIEREEQLLLVAQRIAEASRSSSAARVAACLEKLRHVETNEDAIAQTASAVDAALHIAEHPMKIHGDLDIARIFELLED